MLESFSGDIVFLFSSQYRLSELANDAAAFWYRRSSQFLCVAMENLPPMAVTWTLAIYQHYDFFFFSKYPQSILWKEKNKILAFLAGPMSRSSLTRSGKPAESVFRVFFLFFHYFHRSQQSTSSRKGRKMNTSFALQSSSFSDCTAASVMQVILVVGRTS